jgi:hypothetical protein
MAQKSAPFRGRLTWRYGSKAHLMRSILILLSLFAAARVFAVDCNYIPKSSVCGVPIESNLSSFEKTLGAPDGTINMGKDRVGLLYGQKTLLVFWHNRLWQVHAWETNSNMDFWSYVRNSEDRVNSRFKIADWSPWGLSRADCGGNLNQYKSIDGDQFGEIKQLPGATLSIFYEPTFKVNVDPNDWQKYTVKHLKIEFSRK